MKKKFRVSMLVLNIVWGIFFIASVALFGIFTKGDGKEISTAIKDAFNQTVVLGLISLPIVWLVVWLGVSLSRNRKLSFLYSTFVLFNGFVCLVIDGSKGQYVVQCLQNFQDIKTSVEAWMVITSFFAINVATLILLAAFIVDMSTGGNYLKVGPKASVHEIPAFELKDEEEIEEVKVEEAPVEVAPVEAEPVKTAPTQEVKEEIKKAPAKKKTTKKSSKAENLSAPVVKEEEPVKEEKVEEVKQTKKTTSKTSGAKKNTPAATKSAQVETKKVEETKKAPVKKAAATKTVNKKPSAKKETVKPAPVKEEVVLDPIDKQKHVYHLTKEEDGRWKVKYVGGKTYIAMLPTQKEAVTLARDLVNKYGGTFFLHNSKGKNKGKIQ